VWQFGGGEQVEGGKGGIKGWGWVSAQAHHSTTRVSPVNAWVTRACVGHTCCESPATASITIVAGHLHMQEQCVLPSDNPHIQSLSINTNHLLYTHTDGLALYTIVLSNSTMVALYTTVPSDNTVHHSAKQKH